MFPMNWHQHQDYDDGAHHPRRQRRGPLVRPHDDFDGVSVNVDGAALTVPDEVRGATVPPLRVETEAVADGMWLIAGGNHHSVAVEFGDFVASHRGTV